MFPKKGKFFPNRERRPGTEIRFQEVIGEALCVELRGTGRTAKTIMEWTGASERTVKNWLTRRSSPRGPHLICLMRHSARVLDAVLHLAGRDQLAAGMHMIDARNACAEATRRFDLLMCRR
jgi:hypothetical protein